MPTHVLTRDGRLVESGPDRRVPVPLVDAGPAATIQQQLDRVFPLSRPLARAGGIHAKRSAERRQARTTVEQSPELEAMRGFGPALRTLATTYEQQLAAARRNPHLSEAGRAAAETTVRAAFERDLLALGDGYTQRETALLERFDGRGALWAMFRDKAQAPAVANAQALAIAIAQWPPEDALAALEDAVTHRDAATVYFVAPIIRNLVATDARYDGLAASAEPLLEDATLAIGDSYSDAQAHARLLAEVMREQLGSAARMVANSERWDPVFDSGSAGGLLSAFASETDAGADAGGGA